MAVLVNLGMEFSNISWNVTLEYLKQDNVHIYGLINPINYVRTQE